MAKTENKLNGLDFTSEATLNRVTFQDSPDTSTSITVISQDLPISLKQTSVSDRDNTRATARKPSITSISEIKLAYHKFAVVFGICCIVMLLMLPVIFYYVNGNSDVSDVPPSGAIGNVNVSQVHMHAFVHSSNNNCM